MSEFEQTAFSDDGEPQREDLEHQDQDSEPTKNAPDEVRPDLTKARDDDNDDQERDHA